MWSQPSTMVAAVGLGLVPVAGHDLWAADEDLAVLGDADRDLRAGPARRSQQVGPVVEGRPMTHFVEEDGVAGQLGHPVALGEADPEGVGAPPEQVRGHRGGAVGHLAQRW